MSSSQKSLMSLSRNEQLEIDYEAHWDYSQSGANTNHASALRTSTVPRRSPNLDMHTDQNELSHMSFQFCLWAHKTDAANNGASNKIEDDEIEFLEHRLVGECFMTMNKFLFNEELKEVREVKQVHKRDRDANL